MAILPSYDQSQSTNNSFGIGLNSGTSFEQGGSENSGFGNSWSESWSKVYGSEASAKDIERAKEANQLTEKWMDKNLAFQEYMSNTAYQRVIADLAKAGLNPYLAATSLGGATTPSGAMATAAKAQTFPDQESYSSSGSHNENSGSSYNIGGSNQTGININLSSGKSSSSSIPALHAALGSVSSALSGEYDKRYNSYVDNLKDTFK